VRPESPDDSQSWRKLPSPPGVQVMRCGCLACGSFALGLVADSTMLRSARPPARIGSVPPVSTRSDATGRRCRC
jgi:hypothetical protein